MKVVPGPINGTVKQHIPKTLNCDLQPLLGIKAIDHQEGYHPTSCPLQFPTSELRHVPKKTVQLCCLLFAVLPHSSCVCNVTTEPKTKTKKLVEEKKLTKAWPSKHTHTYIYIFLLLVLYRSRVSFFEHLAAAGLSPIGEDHRVATCPPRDQNLQVSPPGRYTERYRNNRLYSYFGSLFSLQH